MIPNVLLASTLATLLIGMHVGTGSVGVSADRWSPLVTLAPLTTRTFAPVLDVNRAGAFAAAWYASSSASTPPAVKALPTPTPPAKADVVFVSGTLRSGFGKPVIVGRSGSDIEGFVHVAVSAAGSAYVTWLPAKSTRWLLVVARNGQVSRPRGIQLPKNGTIQRLVDGAGESVDALWFTSAGRASQVRFYCSSVGVSGRIATTVAISGSRMCGVPTTTPRSACAPGLTATAPTGYEVARSPVVARDSQGDAVAVWADWPLRGAAYARGLFAETCVGAEASTGP